MSHSSTNSALTTVTCTAPQRERIYARMKAKGIPTDVVSPRLTPYLSAAGLCWRPGHQLDQALRAITFSTAARLLRELGQTY